MANNPFLKRIMKTEKEDIFHSSAFGQAQSGGTMGAASSSSFNSRLATERDRKIVRGYGDSQIMNGAFSAGPKAKKFEPPKSK